MPNCSCCPNILPTLVVYAKPIERVFAKLKHLLRKAAARTVDTLRTPPERSSFSAAASRH